MAIQAELTKERALLIGMGLKPVKIWLPRCQWYNPDGSINGTLPCDPYSRLLYMGRGLRPDVAMVRSEPVQRPVTLVDAVVGLMQGRDTWEGTASELLVILDGTTYELPVDATRLSKALNRLASQLAVRGVAVEHVKTAKRRGIRLLRRYGA